MSGFVLHPEAYDDLEELWTLIAGGNLAAADRVREEIYASILLLVRFPDQGHWRSDLGSKLIRFQTVGPYLIAYAPAEKPLLILGILHGRRNPTTIASLLDGRK